ncbi:MAG TPA: dihydroneopterin aldolase [Rhodospirillales bacterium]|nr:dihydroneopterin aldolase [Rhodospirillales bacterium]HIN75772.1 dihydroneopterin aldolase [Rhodospirillales bacterium]HIO37338.1 dihydroneopterin aldolase [Rhodospirillales bacterium]HIP10761.1 dihydroneopterin aldolase [Rhodospirillales bacterium]|tara:strand:- start:348 stop:773 length:426 start_codon:yes stop_codon:yes gene_type:complete
MNTSNSNVVHAFRIADAAKEVRHVFIRDLILTCLIGVHKHERKKPQRIRVNLDLAVTEQSVISTDRLADVVCYEDVADRIRSIVNNGHVNLVETLAEKIASKCLEDRRIKATRVRIEKLDVFKDAASAGVEIERFSSLESI